MKIRWTHIGIALLLGGMAFLLIREIWSQKGIDQGLYDFAVGDTSAITRIVIWDKSPDTVVLTRTSGSQWLVNGTYIARHDAIEVILETLYRVRLRNFPQAAAQNTILTGMATYGKRVEVYQGDEQVKAFTVGTETPDMLGTYMLMEGYETPVATYLPGFNGYLSSRFFLREDLWRTRELWPSQDEIVTVSFLYPDAEHFALRKEGVEFSLTRGQEEGIQGDPMACQALIKGIRQVQYEGMIIPSDLAWAKQDSIAASKPVAQIAVQYTDGSSATLSLYPVPGGPDILDENGQPQEFDPDRFYGILSDGRFVLAQRYGIQHVLKSFEAFLP